MIENNLKLCRENLEMTQKELGYTLGVDSSTIAGWEQGKDIIPLKHLYKISNLYNFSMDYILCLSSRNVSYHSTQKLNKVEIGKKLLKLRKQLKLTQTNIANECMISQTTYSNYEKGYYLITTLSLYTICKKHNLSMDEFLDRKKK